MKSIDWYWDTAQHMWRTYFAIERDKPDTLSTSANHIYVTCKQILESDFSERDVTILKAYFTARECLDRYFVEDYSLKNNIPTTVIWMIVRRANRTVIETLGLIEKKPGKEKQG